MHLEKYKVVSHFEKKLEEPMCDDYGDYDDDEYTDGYEASIANDAYAQGYEAAKKDLVDKLSTNN
mgnify:CR=1 FL=1